MKEPARPRFHYMSDEIILDGSDWLTLGQLRALVAAADERGWDDSSLICHGNGGEHPVRHDLRTAYRLAITGRDPA